MTLKLANNAVSFLATGITSSATTIGVLPGSGVKFPDMAAGDWFPLTVVKDDGTLEIMRCVGRSIDALTVQRAQEGTVALEFSAGDRVELRLTKAAIEDIPVPALSSRMDLIDERVSNIDNLRWENKLPLRALSTTFTNFNDYPIDVYATIATITNGTGMAEFLVDGRGIGVIHGYSANSGATLAISGYFKVPAYATYRLNPIMNCTLSRWEETTRS